jgi:CubicO group peptidase (beta-lactamase class C family)
LSYRREVRLLLPLLLLLTALPAAAAPKPDKAALRELDVWIRKLVRTTPVVGMSVSFQHGEHRWARGYGLRDREERLPATPKTSYRYASVTKPMTAVAALRLAERGKLDLDAPIQKYVPYFPKKQWTVTPRHLAGMLGGIPHYVNCDVECHITERYDTEQSIGIFKDWPLRHEPGEEWMYSSYQFNLLGAALEGAAKKSYADVIGKYVWRPARMTSARMDDPAEEVEERAKGYRVSSRGVVPSEFVDVSSRFAGGGTRGDVTDLVRFGRAILDGKLMSAGSFERFTTTMVTNDGENTDYGFGIGTYPQGGRWTLAHSGGQPETTTYLALYPSDDLVIAVATNVEGQRDPVRAVVDKIVSLLLAGGAARRAPAGNDAVADLFASAAYKTFSHGVSRYRWQGPSAYENLAPLLLAFGELNLLLDPGMLAADPESMEVVLGLADDPAGGSLFPLVGRHMASVVARHRGRAFVEDMLVTGPFQLFTAYDDACHDFDCPDALRLEPPLVELARALQLDWARVNTPAVQRLELGRRTTTAQLKEALVGFDTARVKPDLAKEIAKVASPRVLRARGAKLDEAKAMVELAAAFFPRSDVAAMAAAEARLVTGDNEGAAELFARWAMLRPDDEKRPATLRRQARILKRRHKEASVALLDITARLFPEEAPQ